jgi:AcrR family transcriptional regulator
MVERILDAAVSVLRRNGIEGFTNNHVAREAGVSVASIYQFFPNKLAIIYRLFQIWLDELSNRVDTKAESLRGKTIWQPFAEKMSETLSEAILDPRAEYELLRAMWSHRKLLELDRKQSTALARKMSEYMAEYGSRWPQPRLILVAEFANELHTLAAELAVDASHEERRVIDELARVAFVALWRHALTTDCPVAAPIERKRTSSGRAPAKRHKRMRG